jgi:HSP20 family molecular chaperone IbpA
MLNQLIERDPFRAMDDLLGGLFASDARASASSRVVVRDQSDLYELVARVPGLSREAIEISAGEHYIELRFEQRPEILEGYKLRHRERGPYSVRRRWSLPHAIDADEVTARLVDGVLTVELQKRAKRGARAIEIQPAAA